MKKLQRYFVAGLLVWLPLAVTFLLLRFIIGLMDGTLALLPERFHPEQILGFNIPGLGLVLSIVLVLVTGLLAANFVGRGIVTVWESVLQRIPVVRSIYMGAKNFAEVVLSPSGQSFKKVLMIEYPRNGIYSLAFQTGTSLGELQAKTGEEVLCCFVPTTPNPTSGFIVLIPRQDVTELDMSVDQALKMIISLGVVVPEWSGELPRELHAEVPSQPPADDPEKP